MDTALFDAAFRLVSHSLFAAAQAPLSELKRQFPDTDLPTLQDALVQAQRLEDTAIEMADLARGAGKDQAGPALNEQMLAERCPGFSSESYFWAINDGFTLTR